MARTAEQGMTLIEVLVALVVLALGLFGSATLQWRALQATEQALYDSQAIYRQQTALEKARAS
ncbi:pilus assembly protein PilV [Pseudomonas sp. SDI]|uniref:prepilin-type N-terminal cleavage/methylation domain-containing protein n=1 Tax=Pseudomonas sp. SDI TaxID=2170734 RepID=UPI000DE6E908|nr:prepilin-type N-terminal cleavage/methylation domain-containing protein [Pseudomonas sp. SDI]PWB34822.1 pilus assembly protein PilV [Pseudomonas sp. SDI]